MSRESGADNFGPHDAPADAFFAAGAELERLAGELKVDLVPLESANLFYLEQVANIGVVIQ